MNLTSVSLVDTTAIVVLSALGVAGGAWLVLCGRRWYLRRALPFALIAATGMGIVLYVVVEKLWRPFPDPVAVSIYGWIAVGIAAIVLLLPRLIAARRAFAKAVTPIATVCVVVAVAAQINLVFAAYPTVGALLGTDGAARIDLAELPARQAAPVTGVPLDTVWRAPASMPQGGRIMSVTIPPTVSKFSARDAEVYLPPAYFAEPRPVLPVLVLMAGQPGEPKDWLAGGKLVATMDAFAQQHGGLAPVVVVADGTGSALANPLCVDSPLGNVETYLVEDVPNWIESTLQVDDDRKSWIVAGLSYGGTCSLQLATNHPERYPTFLDLSGQLEPTLGDRARTVDAAFGGNEAAFLAVNPMSLLAARKYPGTAGAFVVGADDNEYRPGLQQVYRAARAAGMDVRYTEVPGGHSFAVWSTGLEQQLPWLMRRVGMTS